MTAHVLVTGTLYKRPEKRMSRAGNPFVTCPLLVVDGTDRQYWSVSAFSDHIREELTRLDAGDAVCVQGPMKASIYEKDGDHRVSLSVIANHVLAARQPKGKASAREEAPVAGHEATERTSFEKHAPSPPAPYDDPLPF